MSLLPMYAMHAPLLLLLLLLLPLQLVLLKLFSNVSSKTLCMLKFSRLTAVPVEKPSCAFFCIAITFVSSSPSHVVSAFLYASCCQCLLLLVTFCCSYFGSEVLAKVAPCTHTLVVSCERLHTLRNRAASNTCSGSPKPPASTDDRHSVRLALPFRITPAADTPPGTSRSCLRRRAYSSYHWHCFPSVIGWLKLLWGQPAMC